MKKIFKFLSPLVVLAILAGVAGTFQVFAATASTVVVDTINGVPPSTYCIAGPVAIVGHGTTGGSGGPYQLDVIWGDGVTDTNISTTVPTPLSGSSLSFTFTASHTFVGPTTGMSFFLHHSSASGNDSHTTFASQCVAPPTQGVVNVLKHVVNTGGGTAVASDFTLHVAGNNFAGSETANSLNSFKLDPNTYTVSEDAHSGYSNTGIVCIGDDNTNTTNGQVTVVAGKNYTCTVTNDDVQPKLTVTKVVTNDNGGTKVVSDFPLFVGQTGVTSGVQNSFNAGTYTISETNGTGYAPTISGNCAANGSITLALGDVKSCTITNNDIAPTLQIIKIVTNDNGGTATTASFQGKIDGSDVAWDTPQTLSAGAHTASETNLTGYSAGNWGGDCAANGSVTLALGENKTCTITNNDIQPLLTVTKVVVNDNRGTKKVSDFPLFVDATQVTSGAQNGFNTGAYTISETADAGYNASFSGDCDSAGHITLALGDVKSCTITNNDKTPGTLTVIKHVINDNPEGFQGTAVAGDFTLSITGGNPSPASVKGDENGATVTIDAGGQYNVAETGGPTSSYGVSYSSGCSGTMAEEGTATCTITNNDNPPTTGGLTVVKVVINDNGGTKQVSGFPLHVTDSTQTTTDVTSGQNNQFPAGAYSVSENTDPNYTASYSGDCNSDHIVTIENGQSRTCTITNNDNAPSLALVKQVVNDNGGTAKAESWTLGAVGPSTISGAGGVTSGATFKAGTYSLSESDGPAGYNAGSWSCTNEVSVGEGNQINLGLGQSTTCTIINNDVAPSLTLTKHVSGGDASASSWTLTATGNQESPVILSGAGGAASDSDFKAGTYTLSESSGPANYTAGNWSCTGVENTNNQITLNPGQSASCSITNTFVLDVCPNIVGAQSTIPEGKQLNNDGQCVDIATPPTDVCPNIQGVQASVPTGKQLNNDGQCVDIPTPPPSSNSGGGGTCALGTTFNFDLGRCVPNGGQVLGATTGQVLGAETSCGIYLNKFLQKGRKNNAAAVKLLQTFLNQIYPNAGIKVNGIFDALTDKYVRQFQLEHKDKILLPWGLKAPTGIVYLTTTTAINNIMCPTLGLPIPTLVPPRSNPDFPKL